MPYIIISCSFCHKDFMGGEFPSRLTKYCSRVCMSKSFESSLVEKKCVTCGKLFKIKPFKSKGKFCGLRCIRHNLSKDQLQHRTGKGFWQISNEEQKKERIKSEYERLVIKKEGCWSWKNVTSKSGYGRIFFGFGKIVLAHRASWMVHYGVIPKGMHICHKCDNPICTNPEHLFLGTPKQNTQDCLNKKRRIAKSGSNHPSSKLTENEVIKIKELLKLKQSWKSLGIMFKVATSTIQNIASGKTWKSLKG